MPLYPELPLYVDIENENPQTLYQNMLDYTSQLKFLLEQRDRQQDLGFASRIYTVLSTTDIKRPADGYVSFSTSSGKFRGYVSGTGWVNFN